MQVRFKNSYKNFKKLIVFNRESGMCFDCCNTDNCNTMVDLSKIFGQTTNSSGNALAMNKQAKLNAALEALENKSSQANVTTKNATAVPEMSISSNLSTKIPLNTTDSSEPEDILNDVDLSNQSDEKPVVKKNLKNTEHEENEQEPVEVLDDQEYQNEESDAENGKESKEKSFFENIFGGSDSANSKENEKKTKGDDSSLFGLFDSKEEYVQDQPENATIAQNDTTASISTGSSTEPSSVEPSSASVYINSLVLLVLGLLIQVNL